MRFFGRGVYGSDGRAADRNSVHRRTLWSERAAQHGWTVVVTADRLHLVQDSGQALGGTAEIGCLADGAAVGVKRDFVVWAERSYQCRVRLIHFLQGGVGHAKIEHDGHRELEGVASEKCQLLLLAVFIDGEI